MKLYIRKELGDGLNSRELLWLAAGDYAGHAWCREHEVETNCHGKPYFVPKGKTAGSECEAAVHFSISHTKGVWCCVFAGRNVGLDVERRDRQVGWEQITHRFFRPEEQAYVRSHGEHGFFQLWVRKEAWLKHRGTGLSGGLGSVCLVEEGNVCHQVDGVAFFDVKFTLEEENGTVKIAGAACMSGEREEMEAVWI